MSQVNQSKVLPKKEAELFRTLVNCYETKQYTKGLKTADLILKKYPNNGETQAMKGIILNSLGRKEEAYELAKSGLRNDVRSHVCWHVYGLIYRSDNNYKEAIKCYLNALKIDPNNQNILRDLSWLQMQMRDVPGFLSTRKTILQTKPTLRASWVAYAVATFVSGEYKETFDIISKYRDTVVDKAEAYEESEFLLFQNSCLEKDGKYLEAIDHLSQVSTQIVDKLALKVKQAQLQQLSGNFEESRVQWQKLVVEQPENYRFHAGFQASVLELSNILSEEVFLFKKLELPSSVFKLTSSEKKTLLESYSRLNLKSRATNKIIVHLSTEEHDFPEKLSKFIKSALDEGIPSLTHDIVSFAMVSTSSDPNKLRYASNPNEFKASSVISMSLSIIDNYIDEIDSFSNNEIIDIKEKRKSPQTLLWAFFLKANLLEKLGEYQLSLDIIAKAIDHTPTAIDILTRKARLLKKLGDLNSAAIVMDECRMLDLQDRYLNNKATKYFLRADNVSSAMQTIALFTKHEGDPQRTLYDLQCSWYELELAESYSRQKMWGPALKRFHAIKQHFIDQYDDLFDFHGYCVRKTTLRAYLDVMNVQDSQYAHKNYQRALTGVLKIYLHLLDCPEDIDGLGHLSSSERKKERAKQKKRKQKEEEDKAKDSPDSTNIQDNSNEENSRTKDSDPSGEALLQKDFLTEANLWCSYISNRLESCSPDILALYSEVMFRRFKLLPAIKALVLGYQKDPFHPEILASLVKMHFKLKTIVKKQAINPDVLAIVKQELSTIFSGESITNVTSFAEKYFQKSLTTQSMIYLLGALKCKTFIDKASTIPSLALFLDENFISDKNFHWGLAVEIHKFLLSQYSEEKVTQEFFILAQSLFKKALYFNQAPINESSQD